MKSQALNINELCAPAHRKTSCDLLISRDSLECPDTDVEPARPLRPCVEEAVQRQPFPQLVSTDEGADALQAVQDAGIDKLAYYADNSAKIFQTLKTVARAAGLPTSLIVDPTGCEIGTIAGPAEWASPEAVALVAATLQGEERTPPRAQSRISDDKT